MNANVEGRSADVIDLHALMQLFWQWRRWIGVSVVICLALFLFLAFTMTPIFRSTIVMAPASAERNSIGSSLTSALGQLGGLASLAGIAVGSGDTETEQALAVLRSRQFTEDYIRDKQLLPVLFPGKWDAVNQRWKVDATKVPTLGKGYEVFNKQIRTIIQDKKTGLITVQIDWRDRNEAAVWANELTDRLNAEMRSRAIVKADAAVGYLEKESLNTTVVSTRDAISRLIEAEIRQRMLANVTREYAFGVVDRALPADPDDPVRPKKWVLGLTGLALGLVIGMFRALIAPTRP
ncbi:MAG TPA: Wzz/FepE/Etk N-terminal domain-containing protein [Steroidobacteraceae bacterium]|jgi:uncharacterized protein involved in exopolysaccharide biosynthesis